VLERMLCPIGMQVRVPGTNVLLATVSAIRLFSRLSGLPVRDHPTDHVTAIDIEDDVQVIVGPFSPGPRMFCDIPAPHFVGNRSPKVRAWHRPGGCADGGASRSDSPRPAADTSCGWTRNTGLHRATWRTPRPAPCRGSVSLPEGRAADPARQSRRPSGGSSTATSYAPRHARSTAPVPVAVHEPRFSAKGPTGVAQSDVRHELGDDAHRSRGCDRPRSVAPVTQQSFFWCVDDQLGMLEFATQTGDIAVENFDLPGRRVRLRPASLRSQSHLIGRAQLLAPAREHRRIDMLAAQKRSEPCPPPCSDRPRQAADASRSQSIVGAGRRDDLRVGRCRDSGHPFTRPTGSFRMPRVEAGCVVRRNVHHCCHG